MGMGISNLWAWVLAGGVFVLGTGKEWILAGIADLAIQAGWDWGARMALTLRGGKVQTIIGRRRLDGAYPLERSFADSQEVYAAWVAGRGALSKPGPVSAHTGTLKRLILPDPRSDSVGALGEICGWDVSGEVIKGAGLAVAYGVEVRHYPGFWGVEVTIGDPGSKNGWAHVSPNMPGMDEERRVHLRVEKRKAPEIFDAIWAGYNAMWDQSIPSSPEALSRTSYSGPGTATEKATRRMALDVDEASEVDRKGGVIENMDTAIRLRGGSKYRGEDDPIRKMKTNLGRAAERPPTNGYPPDGL